VKVGVLLPPYYIFWGTRNGWMFQKPLNSLAAVNLLLVHKERGDEVKLYNPDAMIDSCIEGDDEMIARSRDAIPALLDLENEIYEVVAKDLEDCDLIYVQVHQCCRVSALNVVLKLLSRDWKGKVKTFGWSRLLNFEHLGDFPEDKVGLPSDTASPVPSDFFYGIRIEEMNAVEFNRGCPYLGCLFCCKRSVRGKRRPVRSPSAVVHDITKRMELGVKKFYVIDDDFTDRQTLSFLKGALPQIGDFEYMCEVRADTFLEAVDLLAETGCKRIKVGVEVYDDSALKKLNKGITEKQIDLCVETARKLGIEVSVYILLTDLLGIGRREYKKTIEWLRRVQPDYVTVSVLEPYEGTQLQLFMEKYPEIVKMVPAHWNYYLLEAVKKSIGEDVVGELFDIARATRHRRVI
jgi:radical SAM superfamily enzyme YgiQ (UPF0313 family)